MKIRNVSDPCFSEYGKIINIDSSEIVDYLSNRSKMPEEGNLYVRDDKDMASLKDISKIKEEIFGEADIEVGYCNGFNSKLNCMEYHATCEVDVAADDIILLLGKIDDIHNGLLDSKDLKAFLVKKGQAVCLYPYTLHFSPCKCSDKGFHTAIILPDKTNADLSKASNDKMLWKINKWLIAHKESKQASLGAYVGIIGENIQVDYK